MTDRRPAGRPPRRFARALLIIVALLAVCGAGAWWFYRPVAVKTAPVTRGVAVDAVYASGVVEYVRQARLAAVVTAPISRVLVEEGETVRAGQPLVELYAGPAEATALQLEALAAQARAAENRQVRLQAAGFGAAAVLQDARQQRIAAEAAARSARARLADYRLTAPFAGRLLRRDAEPGDLATAGKTLLVVADPRALRITADIDERDVGRLEVGQAAIVRSDSFLGRTFPAAIREITPQGDSAGRTFRARLRLDSDSPLRPGMTVEANLVTGRRSGAVLAPTLSLREGSVWVVVDGRARKRPVRTGAQGAEKTEITSGLKPGDRVILAPTAKLKDGARLRIVG